MMEAVRIETVVGQDGNLTLTHLPFRPGDRVEVIVLGRKPLADADHYPLRGKLLRYDRPTEPVAADEWESAQ